MRENGRRRWRKWAKKGLDIVSGYTARRLNKRRYWNRRRRHRNAVDVTGPLPPLPAAKPFDVRSLVGMTMGARKRATWREVFLSRDGAHDFAMHNGTRAEQWAKYNKLLSEYRIGERPRPCPGCYSCLGGSASGVPKLGRCDGSGLRAAHTNAEQAELRRWRRRASRIAREMFTPEQRRALGL